MRFQFTHPVRGATINIDFDDTKIDVSIHAPRAGCDRKLTFIDRTWTSFNSRTPCGVRPSADNDISRAYVFQFTHPVRGATMPNLTKYSLDHVSIHAPRAGCDYTLVLGSFDSWCFNSRTPCGVRLRCSKVRINRGLDDDPLRTEN